MANNNSTDKFKDTIKAYLDKRAEQDELFRAVYAKKNKNIDECCRYIVERVQKAGICGWSNAEIFGMAIHYYQEDNIKVGKSMPAVKIVNTNGHDGTKLSGTPTSKGKGASKPTPPQKPTTTPPKSTTPTPQKAAPSKPSESKPSTTKPQYTASLFDLWQGKEN